MLNIVKYFSCIYWDGHIIFILHFFNVVHHIDRFANMEPCLPLWSKSHLIMVGSFFYIVEFSLLIQSQRKALPKNAQTTAQLHVSKVMLKILQDRLQQFLNRELPDLQAGFRKGRGTRDQIANIHWIIEKTREFQKNTISALLTMPKPLTVWITINYGKFLNIWEHQITLPISWKTCVRVKKQ